MSLDALPTGGWKLSAPLRPKRPSSPISARTEATGCPVLTTYLERHFTHLRMALFTRVRQPRGVALGAASTSASKRIVVGACAEPSADRARRSLRAGLQQGRKRAQHLEIGRHQLADFATRINQWFAMCHV